MLQMNFFFLKYFLKTLYRFTNLHFFFGKFSKLLNLSKIEKSSLKCHFQTSIP